MKEASFVTLPPTETEQVNLADCISMHGIGKRNRWDGKPYNRSYFPLHEVILTTLEFSPLNLTDGDKVLVLGNVEDTGTPEVFVHNDKYVLVFKKK